MIDMFMGAVITGPVYVGMWAAITYAIDGRATGVGVAATVGGSISALGLIGLAVTS